MTIDQWLIQWTRMHGAKVRPATMRGYNAALAHLSAAFRALELCQVTAMDWETEIATIKATYPRQAELAHIALRKSWKDGQRLKLITWDNEPWRYIEPPHHQKRDTAYLLPEEMPAYYRAAMETKAALPLYLMLTLGLRRGEALGLGWCDIDTRTQIITIKRQLISGRSAPLKTQSSYRKIPVNATVIGKIYNWVALMGFYFITGRKKPFISHTPKPSSGPGLTARSRCTGCDTPWPQLHSPPGPTSNQCKASSAMPAIPSPRTRTVTRCWGRRER